ncbi:hypothetical protein SDC9_91031 [bioreactor metagenome]|uniref:Uncharacterized protein n=1 Tax=bioreactor metagenome TaxID=1076179 RepID=A0A645A0H7_9ZZZZ
MAHVGGPHVARRQEHLEVKHVVRVLGAAETNLHSLTVHGVGVDQRQQSGVTALCAEVRNQQHVADAGVAESQLGGSRRSTQVLDGMCATSKAHHSGSDAQSENILLHRNSS